MPTEPTKERAKTYDCRSCGLCCTNGDYSGPAYPFVDVTRDDLHTMGAKKVRRLVVIDLDEKCTTGLSLSVKRHPKGITVCSALRGRPGHRCSCGIYEVRPQVCRDFQPGSPGCLEHRAAYESLNPDVRLKPPR